MDYKENEHYVCEDCGDVIEEDYGGNADIYRLNGEILCRDCYLSYFEHVECIECGDTNGDMYNIDDIVVCEKCLCKGNKKGEWDVY
jgi:hypothetical protein